MKTEIEQLIDRLSDKSLTFGQKVYSTFYEREMTFVAMVPDDLQIDGWFVDFPWSLDGTLTRDNTLENGKSYPAKILGHPILKCHIEAKIPPKKLLFFQWGENLTALWLKVDPTLSKSLQEIYAEAKWENMSPRPNTMPKPMPTEQPIRELFEFLLTLGL